LVNLCLTAYISVKDILNDRVQKKLKKAVKERLLLQRKNRETLLKEFPEQLQYFKQELDLMEALEYCKKWNKERKWLKKSGIDFSDFPEEIKFNKLAVENNIFERSYIQRLIKVLNEMAWENTEKRMEAISILKKK
jgi:hypothetical protein